MVSGVTSGNRPEVTPHPFDTFRSNLLLGPKRAHTLAAMLPPSELPVTPPAATLAPGAPAFPALRYAAWLTALVAVVCLVTKVHKLALTAGGDLGSGLAALFPDVVFVLGSGLVAWLGLRFSRGRARVAVRVVLHLVTFLAMGLAFVEHGFWLATGTLLDPYVLGYGLTHFGSLGKVYLSAMGPLVWVGLAALVAVHLLPLRAARAGSRPDAVPTRLVTVLAAAMLAVTGVAALVVDLAPGVAPLGRNVVLRFAGAALTGSEARAQGPVVVGAREVAVGSGPRAIPDGPPPNVIVIMMESVRASATTLHDPALDTTPFLASLAERGALVETTWTSVTHTSKALVGALCGIWPLPDLPVVEAEATGLPTTCLARILRGRGYATAFMQTATATFEQRRQTVDNMGYETFLSKESIPQGDHEETNYFGWEDDALLGPALDFADAREKDGRPFLLTLLNLSTHHTYETPSDFPKKQRASGELDAYLNSVAYFDGFLARLFAGLEARGALGRTLVILAGDHGEAFGEHGTLQHNAAIYEEGLHVPLVLVGPGIAPGTRIKGLRHLIDVVPTALEWLGTPVSAGLPGRSLLSSPGHDTLFASCWLHLQCIATRDATYKYIWHFDKQAPELFDLTRDPLERTNILDATPEAVWGPMKARLLGWKADTDAAWESFLAQTPDDYLSRVAPTPLRALDLRFSAAATGTAPEKPLARLIGYDMPTLRVKSGEPIPVTLHWEVLGPTRSWYPFTYLLGRSKGTRPTFNANHGIANGRHPTSAWEPGTFVSDRFLIQPETPLPPGVYELVVGFFTSGSSATGTAARAVITAPEGGGRNPGVELDGERRAHLIKLEVSPAGAANEPSR